MRTKKATAPERFEELQTMSVRSFTSRDLQEMMGISKSQADAVINFGASQDKIRVVRRVSSHDPHMTLYELSNWRREWITKPWGVANVSRDSDRMAPD